MKNHIVASIIFLFIMACHNKKVKNVLKPLTITEKYFKTEVNDDYRYVEENDNPDVLNWIDKQNNITQNVLSKIESKNRLMNLQKSYDKNTSYSTSKLQIVNKTYFYLKRLPEENTPKLYCRKGFEGEEVLLYDPKTFITDQESIINYYKPSWSAEKVAVSITSNGKEVSQIIIVDVESKTVSRVILKNAWPAFGGGIQWLTNDSGFTYPFFPVIDRESEEFKKNSKIVYYKLGSKANKLKSVFSKQNNTDIKMEETDFPTLIITNKNDKYIIGDIRGANDYRNAYVAPMHELLKKPNWKPLFSSKDKVKYFQIKGDSIIFRTAKNSPNFKICITSLINPDFDNPKVLIAEKRNEVITDFALTTDGLFYTSSKNGVEASLYQLNSDGNESKVNLLKSYGNIDLYSSGPESSKLWFDCTGWSTTKTRFEYEKGELTEKNIEPTNNEIDLSDVVVKEIEVKGHDGTMIPLSLIYRKGLKLDGSNALLIDGYGAFGISRKPNFSLRRMLWVYEGGIYAVAHVRGGGEKGDAWHKGGFKETKPNTWKDFISCADYLIRAKYTNNEKLAAWSGSAGGIMVGRAITERPDLFKAAIVEFGVLNVLKTKSSNKDREYGSIRDSLSFEHLIEMDAYYHLKKGTKYPATLLTHGLNDPRVEAWQTLKFAAKMQHCNVSDNPNLISIDKNTGHVGKTKAQKFETYANILAFALWQTGHPGYQLKE